MPAPRLFTRLPDESNLRMGARSDLAQEVPPRLSTTQMLFLSRSMSALITCPHVLPSGSFAQFSTVRYGVGAELGSAWACALVPDIPDATTEAIPSAMRIRFTCNIVPSRLFLLRNSQASAPILLHSGLFF